MGQGNRKGSRGPSGGNRPPGRDPGPARNRRPEPDRERRPEADPPPRGDGPATPAPGRRGPQGLRSRRLDLLNRIGTAALRETDLDVLLAEVARDSCRLLELPRCAIRLFGDPGKAVEHAAPEFGPPATEGFPLPHETGGDVPGPVVRVPLTIGEESIGTLSFDLGRGRLRSDDDVATAGAVARQVAMAVRHARLFGEVQSLATRLLHLMNNVPGLVYRGLPDGSVTFIGAGAEELTGHPPEAFLGRKVAWRDLVHPDDLPAVNAAMRGAIHRRERLLRAEYRVRHRDGGYRWIADRRQLIYGPSGRLAVIDGLALDITERKETEEKLRLTQLSVDRAGDSIYWMDPDGRLLYVNDRFCDALGYDRGELLGMMIQDINPEFPREIWPAHWEELRRRKSWTMESVHRAKDGRLIPVEVTVNHVTFHGTEYNCASARDITERRRAQEESRKLQAQLLLARKIEAVALLAGGVAHDFNNLLTAILGHGSLLAQGAPEGSEASKAAYAILAAAERASVLTAQLLGFARKGKNLSVPVDLRRTLEEVLAGIGGEAASRVRLAASFHEGPWGLLGDPGQIGEAFRQLVANALEAMPDGGVLAVATEPAVFDDPFCRAHPGAVPGRYVLVKVSDTGVGIPDDLLGRVFDPFFTTKGPGKGTGLGLSMVYGIVKSHGGYIDVSSAPGRGTTFLVYLPLAPVEAHQLEIPFGGAPHPPADRERVVLLVDDQEAVREVCGAMLATLGFRVVQAADGKEGLETYRRAWREIDLVILDMMMPGMNGADCFRGMKEVNPRVRALLATGFSQEGAVQEALDGGAAGFIQKPFRREQLARAVSAALGRPG